MSVSGMKKIILKNDQEIKIIREGGRLLKKVVKELLPLVKEGITTEKIDQLAEGLIKKKGAYPSFKKVKGYQWATCLPINNQIVHTPPSKRKLKRGDVLTIDMGVYYRGYHTDWATTIVVGVEPFGELNKFLNVGRQTLINAINQFKIGNYIGDISWAIERGISKNNYFVIKELTGHGIGKQLHEEPLVPCFLEGDVVNTPKIKEGMVLAIEVIYSQKNTRISYEKENQWSIVTKNGCLSACFEHTVALFKNRPLILT